MASYTPTNWSDARGSVAGHVYSNGAAGPTARSRRVPSNRRTPAQNNAKSAMATLCNAWTTQLNATQRYYWTLFGQSNPVYYSMGGQVVQSGQNCFIQANMPIFLYTSNSIALTPGGGGTTRGAPGSIVYPSVIDTSFSPQHIEIYMNAPVPTLSTDLWFFFISKPQNAGRGAAPKQFIFAYATYATDNSTPPYQFYTEGDHNLGYTWEPGQAAWVRGYWWRDGVIGASTTEQLSVV
jgi:hypothetical protein